MDPMTAPFCSMFPVTCEGSQFNEDEILAAIFGDRTGAYVDVGAFHPVECSNTWRLYERGWRGLLIEPNPTCWWGLLTGRPLDALWPVAASDKAGYCELTENHSVSTLRGNWAEFEGGTVLVKTQPLRETLELFPDIRANCLLCSIDVEGHEREVLLGIDWHTFRPEVFVIEYRDYNPHAMGNDISGEWRDIFVNAGYGLTHTTDLNQIWRRLQ